MCKYVRHIGSGLLGAAHPEDTRNCTQKLLALPCAMPASLHRWHSTLHLFGRRLGPRLRIEGSQPVTCQVIGN